MNTMASVDGVSHKNPNEKKILIKSNCEANQLCPSGTTIVILIQHQTSSKPIQLTIKSSDTPFLRSFNPLATQNGVIQIQCRHVEPILPIFPCE